MIHRESGRLEIANAAADPPKKFDPSPVGARCTHWFDPTPMKGSTSIMSRTATTTQPVTASETAASRMTMMTA